MLYLDIQGAVELQPVKLPRPTRVADRYIRRRGGHRPTSLLSPQLARCQPRRCLLKKGAVKISQTMLFRVMIRVPSQPYQCPESNLAKGQSQRSLSLTLLNCNALAVVNDVYKYISFNFISQAQLALNLAIIVIILSLFIIIFLVNF